MTSIRNDRGQATVLTVVFLVALLGAVAMVLDVGSWMREQRDTQSAADAAALAAAQSLPESTGTAGALAAEYLNKNRGGVSGVSFSTKTLANDTVTVTVERQAPGVFAKLFGIDSVTVNAKATARAGNISTARYAAPIAVDKSHPLLGCRPLPCFGAATTLDLEKVGPGAFRLLNLDGSRGGTGSQSLADWIAGGFDGNMPLGWYFSDPGAKFNSSNVKNAMDLRLGDELLFPIYDQTREQGSNFDYHVIGWVGFVVTGFSGNGNKGKVEGHFVRVIWEGIQSVSGGQEDFGVRAVQLVE
jgi:secretion/DNA translocation related TadE-like protein